MPLINLRVTEDEREQLKRLAREEGISVSELIRSRVLRGDPVKAEYARRLGVVSNLTFGST
jgi:hypothetical protein